MQLLFAALALDALFSSATLSAAHTGALVVEVGSGKVVYARHADDAFIPASVMKLVVGSVALERLGDGFSFTTNLSTDGSTLYLESDGDPLLDQADAEDAARTIDAVNIRSFAGGIRATNSMARPYRATRYPDGWQVDDLPYDYAAPVSDVSFAENALHITVTPAASVSMQPAIAVQPNVTTPCILNSATTGERSSKDTTDLKLGWNYGDRDCLYVTGSIPLGSAPETLDGAAIDPELVAVDVFSQALHAHGIALPPVQPQHVEASQPFNARELWVHHSVPLPGILRDMWQPSDNLLAETLLERLGLTAPDLNDTRAAGIRVESDWLKSIGVDPATLTIADGSGMSAYDRVTPRSLVAILMHDWNSPARSIFLAALPVAGKSGTLEHEFKSEPLAGNVIAKTGTSNHTRTLAGYLQTPHGTLIFALLVNGWMDSEPDAAARLHSFQEQFLQRIRAGSAGV